MNVQGIIMQPENIRLLIKRLKHQTRRLLKPQPTIAPAGGLVQWNKITSALDLFPSAIHDDCWYGIEGDLLYVRESCSAIELNAQQAAKYGRGLRELQDGVLYPADGWFQPIEETHAAAMRWDDLHRYGSKRGHGNRRGRTAPAIHAPRWTSRITLKIKHVRAEPLLAITDADAKAEGMADVAAYLKLWDRLHGPGSAESNPWVWVIEFDIRLGNVDQYLAERKAA